jgi:hypothetical protein
VDANATSTGEGHKVFGIAPGGVSVELHGIGVTGGGMPPRYWRCEAGYRRLLRQRH